MNRLRLLGLAALLLPSAFSFAQPSPAYQYVRVGEPADVSYKIDRPHDPSEDVSVAFDDCELAIAWPLPVTHMSQRDRRALSLRAALGLLS